MLPIRDRHIQTWYHGTTAGRWTSMGIPSTGAYGSPDGVIFSYPVTVNNGQISVVEGLSLSEFDQQMIAATGQEWLKRREALLTCWVDRSEFPTLKH
ncbi:MAG: hypothetical protein R2867_00165 [Caldilineaceae bacterium]